MVKSFPGVMATSLLFKEETFFIRYFYFLGKALGLIDFKISKSGFIKVSPKLQFFSISFRLSVDFCYAMMLPYFLRTVLPPHLTDLFFNEIITVLLFTIASKLTQVIYSKNIIFSLNKCIDIFFRVRSLTGNSRILRKAVYVLTISR